MLRSACTLAALILIGMFSYYQGTKHYSGLRIPADVKAAVQQGYTCWLETELDGSAQWYCK